MKKSNYIKERSQRIRQYFVSVYLLPVLVFLAACAVILFLVSYFHLDRNDLAIGLIGCFFLGLFVWISNKGKWLPAGDESFFHLNEGAIENKTKNKFTFQEPPSYEAEFRFSVFSFVLLFLSSLAAVLLGIRIFKSNRILFPAFIVVVGLYMMIFSGKRLLNRKPQLKISKEGIWTKNLGFQPWAVFRKIIFNREPGYRSSVYQLKLYLRNSLLSRIDLPDDTINLGELEKTAQIIKLVEQFKRK